MLEDTLVRYDVAYQVIGGTKFYERAEIKDAIAYLNVIVNPDDAISFSRIVNSPRRGIGDTTQARLLSHANTNGVTPLEAAEQRRARAGPRRRGRQGGVALRGDDREPARARRGATTPSPSCSRRCSRRSGYIDALEAERTVEAEGRVENLHELVGVAGEFDANRAVEGPSEISPLDEFLQQISLFTDQDSMQRDDELVTLMTLHNAKGLEFEAVFMIGCEEGVFPHSRSVEEGNLEEERRLCYVGVDARQAAASTSPRRASAASTGRAATTCRRASSRRDPRRAGRAPRRRHAPLGLVARRRRRARERDLGPAAARSRRARQSATTSSMPASARAS